MVVSNVPLPAPHPEDARVAIGAGFRRLRYSRGRLHLRFFLCWCVSLLAERQEEPHHELNPLLQRLAQLAVGGRLRTALANSAIEALSAF